MNGKHWGEKPTARKGTQNNKQEKHISVHENKIYYYSSVNRESAVEFNK